MYFEEKLMLPLTDNEKVLCANEKRCYICGKEFCNDKNSADYKKNCKVRDHCHFTGNYRGAAHSICNLKYKVPEDIPVVFRLCHDDDDKFKVFLRKGVYPYEYMDSWEKFELPVPLDKNLYYSETNDSNMKTLIM